MAPTSGQDAQGQQQKLPAGLAGVLNKPDELRDSAYYSTAGSKHSSTQSQHALPPLESLGRADSSSVTDTPSPISTGGHITHPLNSPASATGAMSVNSIISPTAFQYGYDPNNPHSPLQGVPYPEQHMGAAASMNGDSRRESVDSRLGANFSDMRLASGAPYTAGRSPYASANQSTTSLQSSLAQQRNPGSAHPDRNSGPLRLSNGYQQPSFQQLQRSQFPIGPNSVANQQSRVAPPITGPTMGAIARAPEPTKGQGWAFPEEEVQRIPSAARPSQELANRAGEYYDDSRRNSYADSIASSQYTTESRLPAGQRRLEDGMPLDYQPSRTSSEYQVSTHHHSLQNRQVSQLRTTSPTNSAQPYSRTPELRVSHKLAERKRRTEMKDLFDTLRNTQGVERGAKASKWEILTKAISEHNRQKELIDSQARTIRRQESQTARLEHDLDLCRRETQQLRIDLGTLRTELQNIGHPAASFHAQTATPVSPTHGYGGQQQEQLPPLRSISGAESMNDIQYQVNPRIPIGGNTFRPADRF